MTDDTKSKGRGGWWWIVGGAALLLVVYPLASESEVASAAAMKVVTGVYDRSSLFSTLCALAGFSSIAIGVAIRSGYLVKR